MLAGIKLLTIAAIHTFQANCLKVLTLLATNLDVQDFSCSAIHAACHINARDARETTPANVKLTRVNLQKNSSSRILLAG
jgi:hypothetical protein